MKQFIILLTLAGFSFAIQSNIHYQYKYYGSVSAGIPELSTLAAGSAIKADVHVYVDSNPNVATFQLENVVIAEFNDKLGCDSRDAVPKEYFKPIENAVFAVAIEQPFVAHLFNDQEISIGYSESGLKWLVNLRKGIASVFRNEVLRGNSDNQVEKSIASILHEGHVVEVFSVEEETIFGKCFVEYSLQSIPEQYAISKERELKTYIEIDEQSSTPERANLKSKTSRKTSKKYTSKSTKKTSRKTAKYVNPTTKINETLWHVIRTVNFDRCSDIVGVVGRSIENNDNVFGGQVDFRRSRSSVTEYILRGSPGHFRMEKAIVEGATTFSPFAFTTEVLQGRVNQTFHLVSATKLGTVPIINPEVDDISYSKTWMHEFWSFAPPPQYSKNHPWIQYTGEGKKVGLYESLGLDPLQPEDIANIKNTIIEKIKVVSLILTDLEQEDSEAFTGSPAEALIEVTYMFKLLPKENILEIFDHFFAKDLHQSDVLAKKLVIDAAAASGYRGAINSILEYIIAGKLSDLQIMTVFMTLSSNIECTASLPNILNLILTLDIKERPFVTTTALINYAHIISKMCVSPNARNNNYAGKVFGDYGCSSEDKEKFMPLLTKLLHDERDWVKIVGIVTLEALRSPFAVEILTPIIEGKVGCSTRVRYYAIFALNAYNFNHQDIAQIKDPVVDLLTSIYTNYRASVSLREAALDVVATYRSDAAFWHKIARLSWREPSKRFASFITSLIKTYAEWHDDLIKETHQAASSALKLARPTAPNHEYSQIFWVVEKDHIKHVKNMFGVAVFGSKSLEHITEVFLLMSYDLGGLEVLIKEFYVIASDLFEAKGALDIFHGEPNINKIAAKIAKDFFKTIEGTIKSKKIQPSVNPTLEFYLKLFNDIQIFLPFNKETLSKIADPTYWAEFFVQLAMGHDMVFAKYFNPFDFWSVHATEIGIPVFISGASPVVLTEVAYSSFNSESKRPSLDFVKNAQLTIESLFGISTLFETRLSFFLPWSKNFVEVGVSSNRDIITPEKGTIKSSDIEGFQKFALLNHQSLYKKKFSVAKASNIPYTGIFPYLPVDGSFDGTYKEIKNSECKPKHFELIPKALTGLDLDVKIRSETELSYTLLGVELLSDLELSEASPLLFYILASPTVKLWEIDVTFDPENSPTKVITFEQMIGTFGNSNPESLTQETGDFSQYGQEGYEQYDQEGTEQFSQTPSFDFQEIGNTGKDEVETLAHVNYGDSLQQRSQKMQEYFGGKVQTASMKINFDGDEHRSYEILLSSSKSKPSDLTRVGKFQLSLIRGPIPRVDDKPASVCFDLQFSTPVISELDTFKGLLDRQLKKEIKTEVTLGCTGKPVFVTKISMELSDAWKKKYEEELPEACDYAEENPLFTFQNHAVYDKAKITISWDKVCDFEHYPIATTVLGFTDLVLNLALFKSCRDEDDREIIADIYRCPMSTNWFVKETRGELSQSYENIPHSLLFDEIFAIKKEDNEFIPSQNTPFNLESDKCIVGVDKVRTFDGFKYEYYPTSCWTVAYKDCLKHHEMLLVRSPQGESTLPEAKYIDVRKGLVIDFSRNTIKVNGKVVDPIGGPEIIKDEDGEVTLVKVYKRNDYYKIKLKDDHYILFKDQIEISVNWLIYGHACGLCGDSDGEPEAELVGPHRCLFSDPNLFVSSWTAGSDTCDLYSLMELRQEVEEFQETKCHTIDDLENSCGHTNSPCIFYEWDIVHGGKDYDVCVSQRPLSFCKPECEIQTFEDKQFTYFCWPQEHTPENLKIALQNNKTSMTSPTVHEPHYETTYTFSVPITCKHY